MNNAVSRFCNSMTKGALVAMAALALAGPIAAQQSEVRREGNTWVETVHGTLSAAGTLSVKLPNGNIVVNGSPQQKNISYTLRRRSRAAGESAARREFETSRLSAINSGDVAVIEVAPGPAHLDLNVQVPRNLDVVRLATRGGNEAVSGIAGRVEVSSSGGNLRMDDIGGNVTASTAGGNVEVGNAGSNVTVKSGGGNIHITNVKGQVTASSGGGNIMIGSAAQAVSASTGGGGIDVKHCGGEVKATTGGGSIDLGQVGGRAMLQTGGGSIHLTSATGPVVANTAGGAIELYGMAQGAQVQTGGGPVVAEFLGGRGFAGSSVQTPAGDVIIYVGPELKATVHATIDMANSHRIRSDFPELKVTSEGGQYGPKMMYAEGNLNGGGPELRVRTSNGNIEFRRARK